MDHFQISPTLDAFATAESAQLPRYMSWYPDREAVGRDAMLLPWDPVTYLFPPVPLLPKVLQKICREHITAVLVCPRWPSAMWWTLVSDLLVEPPFTLPHFRLALKKLTGGPWGCYLDPLVAVVVAGTQ